jgi:NitT/TauT family transport system substrate-binding protein
MNNRIVQTSATLIALTLLAGCSGGVAPTSPSQAGPTQGAASAKTATSTGLSVSAEPAGSAAASAKAAGAATLNVSYAQASTGFGPLYVAKEEGFFARNGVEVNLKRVSGTAQVPALVANEVQLAGVGGNEVINADLGGASLVMIAACSDLPVFSLYARKEFKSVPDLAGKSIGVTARGTSTDIAARLFLRHYDMLGTVNIVPAEADKQGYVELVNGIKLGEPLNTSGITVTRDYLKANPDPVRRFLKAYADAWTFSGDAANKATVLKDMQKYMEVDEESTRIGYEATFDIWRQTKVPATNPKALENILALSDEAKSKTAKATDFFDPAPLEAATKPQ